MQRIQFQFFCFSDDKTDIKTIRDALITFLDKLHSMNKKLDMPTAYKELSEFTYFFDYSQRIFTSDLEYYIGTCICYV